MSSFAFPQPEERTNSASIPVAEHTLAALYALALVGREHLTVKDETFVLPQCQDAIDAVAMAISVEHFKAAQAAVTQMISALEDEYPF